MGWGEGGASLAAQLVKNPPAIQETPVQFLSWEGPWRRDRLPTPVFLGFPGSSVNKESACNEGNLNLSPRQKDPQVERSPLEGHDNPLQYSCLENPYG